MVINGPKRFKWSSEIAEGGQTWPSKFLNWGQHWGIMWDTLSESDSSNLPLFFFKNNLLRTKNMKIIEDAKS